MGKYFTKETLAFLSDLRKNNHRSWFAENKSRYEQLVKDPFLDFISDVGPHLRKVSKNIEADPRPIGGSMFRIHRDVRFSKDKSPYKTYAGAHFRLGGKGAHAPGFYLHIQPGASFMAGGMWMPESESLRLIRKAISDKPGEWKKARRVLDETEARLTRPPQGFDPDHPYIEDIKLKSFTASDEFADTQVVSADFLMLFVEACIDVTPMMKFLAQAVGRPWGR